MRTGSYRGMFPLNFFSWCYVHRPQAAAEHSLLGSLHFAVLNFSSTAVVWFGVVPTTSPQRPARVSYFLQFIEYFMLSFLK